MTHGSGHWCLSVRGVADDQRVVVEPLSVAAFGDLRGRTGCDVQHVDRSALRVGDPRPIRGPPRPCEVPVPNKDWGAKHPRLMGRDPEPSTGEVVLVDR